MNITLWVFQVLLALFDLAGGAYKLFSYDELAKVPATAALPRAGWGALGVLEIVCGILLVVPAATKFMPWLTPAAAAVLVVEALVLSGINARYSLQMAATNPLVWTAGMAVVAAFIAWGRFSLRPLA